MIYVRLQACETRGNDLIGVRRCTISSDFRLEKKKAPVGGGVIKGLRGLFFSTRGCREAAENSICIPADKTEK